MKNYSFTCVLLIVITSQIITAGYCNKLNNSKEKSTVNKNLGPDYNLWNRPFAIGHRGMYKTFPENTLSAISACVEHGMGVEFDVRTSKDGELVIIHDDNFARTTNGGTAKVRDLTLKQIKELNAGSWFHSSFANEKVPTLEETLSLIKEKQSEAVPLAVNIKDIDRDGEVKLINLLKSYNLLKQAFFFDQTTEVSLRLKSLESSVKIGKNVRREDLQQELNEGLIDVFLIWFIPSETELKTLKLANKDIIVNIAGERKNDNVPSAWHDYLISGIDGVLIDYVAEFNVYIRELFNLHQ